MHLKYMTSFSIHLNLAKKKIKRLLSRREGTIVNIYSSVAKDFKCYICMSLHDQGASLVETSQGNWDQEIKQHGNVIDKSSLCILRTRWALVSWTSVHSHINFNISVLSLGHPGNDKVIIFFKLTLLCFHKIWDCFIWIPRWNGWRWSDDIGWKDSNVPQLLNSGSVFLSAESSLY